MLLLADAHAHYYPIFCPDQFLDGAYRNFSRAAGSFAKTTPWIGVICLADPSGQDSLNHFHNFSSRTWTVRPTMDSGGCALYRDDTLRLMLIGGQQIVSREGVEVLALCATGRIADRQRLVEYPALIRQAEGIVVVPWSFGKWWFRRAGVIAQLLDQHAGGNGSHVFLGDNCLRPRAFPAPSQFRHSHLRILPGTDPLPLRRHAQRVGRYGFILQGNIDTNHPAQWLRSQLEQLDEQPRIYGSRSGILRFVQDQAVMQWRKATIRP